MTVSTDQLAAALPDLRSRLTGRVLLPGEGEYDAARVVALGSVDARPAVIVRPADDADVAHTIAFARAAGAALAVRSGGHSGAGHGTVDGGVVLDLRDMTALDIDVAGRTAWAEAGLSAGEFTHAAAEHGLVVGFGDTASVGLGGLTLGGGVGYLARKHGLTIDSLLAADVVTADGTVLRVDGQSHPDLFWAIRGGGGNFGVVTRFRFALQELDRAYGGMLLLPATADTVAGFVAAADAAPDELTIIANVMNCPPLPFVPAEHHGSLVVMALVCWSGAPDAGPGVLAPFRELAEPLADMVRPLAYPELYPPEDPDYRPTAVARTTFLDSIGPDEAALIVDRLAASDAPLRAVQVRVLGGAVGRVPADATAYAHRQSRIMLNVAAFYAGPEERDARTAWADQLAADLRQGEARAYVNFLMDEGPDRVREAYPAATWERLARVKAEYDPENVFSRNQNIAPASN